MCASTGPTSAEAYLQMLTCADFTGARCVTQMQLAAAIVDEQTKLSGLPGLCGATELIGICLKSRVSYRK